MGLRNCQAAVHHSIALGLSRSLSWPVHTLIVEQFPSPTREHHRHRPSLSETLLPARNLPLSQAQVFGLQNCMLVALIVDLDARGSGAYAAFFRPVPSNEFRSCWDGALLELRGGAGGWVV